jgi:uncharacterized membrane protein YbhN (UPF0104 family)
LKIDIRAFTTDRSTNVRGVNLNPIVMACAAFGLILGGAILGAIVRSRLPEHHLTGDSKEVIRLATALVATLTALVLALLFAATRASFEHTSASVSRLATTFSRSTGRRAQPFASSCVARWAR